MRDSKHKQNSPSRIARGLSNTTLPDFLCLPLLLLYQRANIHDDLQLLCKHELSLLQYFSTVILREVEKCLKKKNIHVTPASEELKWEDFSFGATPEGYGHVLLADKLNALQKLNQCPDFTRSQIQIT